MGFQPTRSEKSILSLANGEKAIRDLAAEDSGGLQEQARRGTADTNLPRLRVKGCMGRQPGGRVGHPAKVFPGGTAFPPANERRLGNSNAISTCISPSANQLCGFFVLSTARLSINPIRSRRHDIPPETRGCHHQRLHRQKYLCISSIDLIWSLHPIFGINDMRLATQNPSFPVSGNEKHHGAYGLSPAAARLLHQRTW